MRQTLRRASRTVVLVALAPGLAIAACGSEVQTVAPRPTDAPGGGAGADASPARPLPFGDCGQYETQAACCGAPPIRTGGTGVARDCIWFSDLPDGEGPACISLLANCGRCEASETCFAPFGNDVFPAEGECDIEFSNIIIGVCLPEEDLP